MFVTKATTINPTFKKIKVKEQEENKPTFDINKKKETSQENTCQPKETEDSTDVSSDDNLNQSDLANDTEVKISDDKKNSSESKNNVNVDKSETNEKEEIKTSKSSNKKNDKAYKLGEKDSVTTVEINKTTDKTNSPNKIDKSRNVKGNVIRKNQHILPKAGNISEIIMMSAAGFMSVAGAFFGFKKKDKNEEK